MRILRAAALWAAGVLLLWPGAAAAWAQPQCADWGGTVEAGNTCRIHVANDTYSIDASFPLDYADQRALTDYVSQTRDGFVNVSEMPTSNDLPYQLEIESQRFRSGRPPLGTDSVVLKLFQDVGGPQPLTWYKAFNYDLAARRPIAFDTLFTPGARPLDVIAPIVKRELERETGRNGAVSAGAAQDPTHYQNFALTDTELILFFGEGELVPLSAGPNVVHVPRDAIAGMLAAPPPSR